MLPSYTVENYLKAIFQAQLGLGRAELVPMGRLASALGVVPGTATTMVKTLAESGLVEYEPYSGVALTPAGQKLAALVLRRHRLIELFLVRVMGYAWDEGNDEAEQLDVAGAQRPDLARAMGARTTATVEEALRDMEPTADTALYETLLAVYEEAKTNFDPERVNNVVVLTDGRQDNPDGEMSLSELKARLTDLADPEEPVGLIAIGYGAAAARAWGGERNAPAQSA